MLTESIFAVLICKSLDNVLPDPQKSHSHTTDSSWKNDSFGVLEGSLGTSSDLGQKKLLRRL